MGDFSNFLHKKHFNFKRIRMENAISAEKTTEAWSCFAKLQTAEKQKKPRTTVQCPFRIWIVNHKGQRHNMSFYFFIASVKIFIISLFACTILLRKLFEAWGNFKHIFWEFFHIGNYRKQQNLAQIPCNVSEFRFLCRSNWEHFDNGLLCRSLKFTEPYYFFELFWRTKLIRQKVVSLSVTRSVINPAIHDFAIFQKSLEREKEHSILSCLNKWEILYFQKIN